MNQSSREEAEAGQELSEWIGHTVSYLDEDISFSEIYGPVPASIRHFRNLESIAGSDCPFLRLPDELGELSQLIRISFTNVKISKLPETIGDLAQLAILDVNAGGLESLPESFGQLRSLRELSLWQNSIRQLPGGVAQLQGLSVLDLSDNNLGSHASSLEPLTGLSGLRSLNLRGNRLRHIPESIGLLDLESLNLACNYLSNDRLAIRPGSFPNLKHLSLSLNQLLDLPEFVFSCKGLESLSLEHNLITALPSDIRARLPNLSRIALVGNPITELPEGIEPVL